VSYTLDLRHITNQDQKLDQTHRMPNNPANFLWLTTSHVHANGI